MTLYIALENIPAGHYVVHTNPPSDKVVGFDPVRVGETSHLSFAIGVASENLREGFRVVVRDNEVMEDDA